MSKETIPASKAPTALGPYSQAVRAGYTVYLSGQLGIDPPSGHLVQGIEAQTRQGFAHLRAGPEAAGGSLDDIVKLTILMVDLADFAKVNDIMASCFNTPSPARATYQGTALAKAALMEMEGVLELGRIAEPTWPGRAQTSDKA